MFEKIKSIAQVFLGSEQFSRNAFFWREKVESV